MALDNVDISDEIADPTNTGDSNNNNNYNMKQQKPGGCYISPPVGFVLVLLAVLMAVGVGLIVFFAGGSRDLVCSCQPSGAVAKNDTAQTIRQECLKLAKEGDPEICKTCPAETTTATTTTTTPATPVSLTTTPSTPPVATSFRLPTSVIPLHYNIELQPFMHDPDPRNFTFKGSVQILVRCDKVTDNITLHVNVLTVNSSSIKVSPETPSVSGDPKYVSSEADRERQFFIVMLDKNMQAGIRYWIEMRFTSPLSDIESGFYYSSYKRPTDNQTIYLAATQFEATHARKAFPCFDEPAMKATFNISLVRPADRISLSNMPKISSDTPFKQNGITYVKDAYEQTVQMSTYLLAFVVCDYEVLSMTTKYNVTFSTWAKPQSVNDTRYALETGVKITEYYEDYFGIRYPLPKQDMIAIPHFDFGAMENWGLIAYKEPEMLHENGVSSQKHKKRMATLVSHELGHQWFGNLVTMSWWSDIFLNEAFATFVSYLAVDKAHPDWKMLEMFPVEEMHTALSFDSQARSHPVHVQVQSPGEIQQLFDVISYQKGGSLVRMLRMFLGEETFKQGIIKYLKKFSYKTVTPDDLWSVLTEQAESEGKTMPVKEIMDTWILQMNYPLVTVTRDFNNPRMLHVTQERFLADPNVADPGKYTSPFNYRWSIPLTFTSSTNPQFKPNNSHVQWMYKEEQAKTFNKIIPSTVGPNSWILANVQQYGFYRVNYQLGNWQALARQLQSRLTAIPPVNRAQIINDAFSLARAGRLQYDTALSTVKYLHLELDYIPWSAAFKQLQMLESMLFNTAGYADFQNFMRRRLTAPFSHFGLVNVKQNPVDVLSQSLIAWHSCYYGISSCVDEATRQYKQWMINSSSNMIDPEVKEAVYCHAIANGAEAELLFALKMYKATDSLSEAATLLNALACSRDPQIISHFLKILGDKDSSNLKAKKRNAIAVMAENNFIRPLVFDFIRNKYDEAKDQFSTLVWLMASRTFTNFTDIYAGLQKVISLGDSKYVLGNQQALDRAKQTVESNMEWMTRSSQDITSWLKVNQNL